MGSDLELLLRVHGVSHLALTGVATSGVVLSTVRAASDLESMKPEAARANAHDRHRLVVVVGGTAGTEMALAARAAG